MSGSNPPMIVSFETKQVKELLTALKQIGAAFDKLDKKASAGAGGLSQVALDINSAAQALSQSAKDIRSAAQALKSAAGKASSAGAGAGSSAKPPPLPPPVKPPPLPPKPGRPPKTRGQKIWQAITTSRFSLGNGGGQMMPLVGRTLAALGPEGTAIAALAGGAIAAAKAVYDLANNAAQAADNFNRFRYATGSGTGTAAALAGVGGAIGMSTGALGSAASAFNARITSDPMAMAFASRLGVSNIPGPFGDQDFGKQLLIAVENLRKISDRTERVRMARVLGLEDFSTFASLSDKQAGFLKGDEGTKARIFDPEFEQQSADFLASAGRVSEAMLNFFTALGKPVVKQATDFLNDLASGVNYLADVANKNGNKILAFFELGAAILRGSIGDVGGALDSFKNAMGDFMSPGEALESALGENSRAMHANTKAIDALTGTFGRGERLGRAIPPNLSGEALRQALELGGLRLYPF